MKTVDLDCNNSSLTALFMLNEFEHLFLGKKLGLGHRREVYELKIDNTKVVKYDYDGGRANFSEWNTWENVQNWTGDLKKYKEWLCPCRWISPDGTFMIVDKVEPLPKSRIPKKVPSFLTDHKPDNFGLLNNKVVCIDYEFIPDKTIANNIKMVNGSFVI